jgi:CHAT domain-containing protein
MDALYHVRLDQNATTAEAVRAAQRAVLDQSRVQSGHGHPHAWGAFVSAGRP